MNAFEYLQTLPVLCINVPASTHKWEQFMTLTRPHLGETVYQFAASPIVDMEKEAYEWRDLVMGTKHFRDPDGLYEKVNVFQALDKTLQRPKKQHEYAATYSLYRTTMQAMEYFLSWGIDRFLLLEDDAVPRYEALREVPAPPQDTDLRIWGGAIPMGAHNHDNQQFLGGSNPQWKHIKSPKGLYMTTAYEVTRDGAKAHLEELAAHPHAVDCSWWYTMKKVQSCRLSPVGFVQYGPSDRIERSKEGVFVR